MSGEPTGTSSSAGRLERTLSVILTVCAVLIAAMLVRREFFSARPTSGAASLAPVAFRGWERAFDAGETVGPADAAVSLVVFSDIECPFCRMFHQVYSEFRAERPNDIRMTFVHFPILGHRFAIPAARATECARAADRFLPMLDVLFAKQDSLGLKSWASFAAEAEVHDLAAFDKCVSSTDTPQRVTEGQELGTAFAVEGTPTVIVNGMRYTRPPNVDDLRRIADSAVADVRR